MTPDAAAQLDAITAEIEAIPPPRMIPRLRSIARDAVKLLKASNADTVLAICEALLAHEPPGEHRSGRVVAFEIAHRHRVARDALDWRWLERLGATLDGWASVDHFARKLSGPAWQRGQISDQRIHRWAQSDDEWWRRAALVSTIALNERHLGRGDAARTLAVCERFVDDRNRLQRKALSWALRELAIRDETPVRQFIEAHADSLAPAIVREVHNKLETGHKLAKPSAAMRRRMREKSDSG